MPLRDNLSGRQDKTHCKGQRHGRVDGNNNIGRRRVNMHNGSEHDEPSRCDDNRWHNQHQRSSMRIDPFANYAVVFYAAHSTFGEGKRYTNTQQGRCQSKYKAGEYGGLYLIFCEQSGKIRYNALQRDRDEWSCHIEARQTNDQKSHSRSDNIGF